MVFDPSNSPSFGQDERLPAPHAEGLFRFLKEPLGLRKLEGKALERFWHLVYRPEAELAGGEDVVPYQIAVGYRLVRALALMRGLIQEDETLIEGLADRAALWTSTEPIEKAPQARSNDPAVQRMQKELRERGPVPLLPPAKPKESASNVIFARWLASMTALVRLLGVARHRAGRLGLAGMLDPRRARQVFPRREQILAFEELLLGEVIELIVSHGNDATVRTLVEHYGFDPREARGVVRSARARAALNHAGSLEEERAVILARLDDLRRRAKQAMDLKTERTALRDTAAILGLTRAEPEDTLMDLLKVVKRVSEGSPKPKLLPRTLDIEPGGSKVTFSKPMEPASEGFFEAPST